MQKIEDLEADMKALIIETLELEDIEPREIETEAPLFGEGLGLDSIDALELAIVLEENYGVVINDDPDSNQVIFASVRNLSAFVAEHRVK